MSILLPSNLLSTVADFINDNTNNINLITDKLPNVPYIPYIDNLPQFNSLPFISDGQIFNFPDITPSIKFGGHTFNLNIIRSPIVSPEKTYKSYLTGVAIPPTYPSSLNLFINVSYNNPVELQVGSTCAAHSSACIKEYQSFLTKKYTGQFSPDYVYLNRNNPNIDGMTLENAMSIMQSKGICPLEFYPPGITVASEIPSLCDDAAAPYKINNYAALYQKVSAVDPNPSNTINALKTALFLHGPCLIAFMIYNYYGVMSPTTNQYDGRIWVPENSTQQSMGGHCMTVVGYDEVKGFLIRNSWGSTWNNDGHIWLPYSDFGTVYEAFEIWTTTDPYPAPNPAPIIPAPIPAPIIPTPIPVVDPKPGPAPVPVTPKPSPAVTPKPAPKPVPAVTPKPAPKPTPKPVPKPVPKPTPKPALNPAPKSSPKISVKVGDSIQNETQSNEDTSSNNNILIAVLIILFVIIIIGVINYKTVHNLLINAKNQLEIWASKLNQKID